MTDFETHPAGTAARIAGKTIADWIEFARRDDCLDYMVPSDLRQVISALTRANAATAAAYEVAAGAASFRHDENQILRATWATPSLTGLDDVSEEIRALATPDQTAALDKLIAEAVDSAAETAAQFVHKRLYEANMPACSYHSREIKDTILAASKKGGV